MDRFHLDVATTFSDAPFGRYRDDGKASGEAFRDDVLRPAISKHAVVVVDIDGVRRGIGSSWLEEVFGGMVRHGLPAEEVLRRIEIKSARVDYIDEIKGYISRAAKK